MSSIVLMSFYLRLPCKLSAQCLVSGVKLCETQAYRLWCLNFPSCAGLGETSRSLFWRFERDMIWSGCIYRRDPAASRRTFGSHWTGGSGAAARATMLVELSICLPNVKGCNLWSSQRHANTEQTPDRAASVTGGLVLISRATVIRKRRLHRPPSPLRTYLPPRMVRRAKRSA
jgi:hypothetical protein